MSAFPNWQQYVVMQRRPASGCIPTGFEMILRAANWPGVNFNTFQEEFDLDKTLKPGQLPQNNFDTVAQAIQAKHPEIRFRHVTFQKGDGWTKLSFVIDLVQRRLPVLVSLARQHLSPPYTGAGWHIMPVVDASTDTLTLLWGVHQDSSPHTVVLEKTAFVRIHEQCPGGDDIAYLEFDVGWKPLPAFAEAHAEWLRAGGLYFRKINQFGPRPDYYQSNYWKVVKRSLLAAKEFKCCRCSGEANQVHHLHYDYVGEDHLHPESLVAVCRPCHGLLEYARKAESLISRISRRISLCNGFLEDRHLDQNPAHVYARLVEYQDELAELQRKFATSIYYRNPRPKSQAEADAAVALFRQRRRAYVEQALAVVAGWAGNEKDKAKRLLPLLRSEIENCRTFVMEVFAPARTRADCVTPAGLAEVLAGAERPSAESVPHCGIVKPDFESLVVGIKHHRGHVDGIAHGESVQLVREPNNCYDANAIKVCLQNDETLGYLKRELAAAIACQMDSGMCFRAEVSRIVGANVYVGITIPRR